MGGNSTENDRNMLPELTCVVGKQQFAVFSQAISAAAKVGRELLLHADEQVLKLRCFSDTEQACLAFDFEKTFFEKYLVRATGGEIKCKVPLKCCQFAFRSAGKVEQMALTLHERIDHTICFNFRGKYATVKTCSFFYSKSEVFNVNFDKTKCMNRFTGRTGMLNELLTHIRGTDEMTLMVETKSQHVRLSSFHSSIEDAAIYKTLKTELSVNCTEFSEPHLERDVELTFNLTEFKALVAFCAGKDVGIEEVVLHFNEGGKPICVASSDATKTRPTPYCAELIISTAQYYPSNEAPGATTTRAPFPIRRSDRNSRRSSGTPTEIRDAELPPRGGTGRAVVAAPAVSSRSESTGSSRSGQVERAGEADLYASDGEDAVQNSQGSSGSDEDGRYFV